MANRIAQLYGIQQEACCGLMRKHTVCSGKCRTISKSVQANDQPTLLLDG